MANKVHAFKHRDVVRVVKAARAAGVEVDQITVDPHSGAITVGPAASHEERGRPDDATIEAVP